VDYRLEVMRLRVSDVDRAKDFYQGLGWRLDGDFSLGEGIRAVQVTLPGSACSVSFGTGITAAAARRRRTVGTRPRPGGPTRTGRPGTRSTWRTSRPGGTRARERPV